MAREKWSSRTGFLLAGIGSAVGLGNVWRFPYIVGQNGGGAFLIPYIIAIFVLGLPLMMLEFSVGREFKGSVVSSMKKINVQLRWVGIIIVMVSIIVLSYYLVVTGWTIAYLILTLLGKKIIFDEFTLTYYSPIFFIVVTLITSYIVMKGIKGGIEKTSKIMVPALGILMMAMVIYAFTLPNAFQGISFYLTPDFSKLSDYSVWAAAFGQAFFSLSVGSGILLTYGSYLDEKISIPNNSIIITISDLLISFFSGLVVFSIVFSFGFEPAAGPKLAFSTIPIIFDKVPYGFLLAAVFFLLLFFAALTSAISMLEVGVSTLVDELKMTRHKATSILTLVILVLGFPAALSYSGMKLTLFNTPVFDLMDTLFGSIGLMVTALLISVSVTWFMDNSIMKDQMKKNTHWNASKIVFMLVKYVIPIILIYVLAVRIIFYLNL
ncbi:MAG TPA: sodium-dependent transporter [Candidatus Nanoarchaeia archaeon]|nr:sodium-dependent transporter [Candidatus Nanoarchaeia archaeon]